MGSRIIITTRIIDIAKRVGGYYSLKPLSVESSEILFYSRIFGLKDCPAQFSEVSEHILKKCGGVPLAIITTSSMLVNKSKNIKEWHDVCNSMGSGLLGSNPDMDNMWKILLLSYYDLPSHLKTCLLYLSIFPEDYEITKDQLIWKWIAEGFVQDKQGEQSFLEIGESYFNELINRSLIQPTVMDVEGIPQACRVHDIVLDLIISLSKEECFITIVLGDDMHSLQSKQVRRLSLHNNTDWPTTSLPKLRSLTIFKPDDVVIDLWRPSLSQYHLLRVLDLGACKHEYLTSLGFVGSLSHLRFLGLSSYVGGGDSEYGNDELPVEIGKLRFLQTLDLSKTEVARLPTSIIGLTQLICLHGGRYYGSTMLPEGLKNLTSLEVLESVIVMSESNAEELGYLTQLRILEVMVGRPIQMEEDDDWRDCERALVESLGKLKKIESIHIRQRYDPVNFDGSMEEPLGKLLWLDIEDAMAVPTWIRPASLPALSYLCIRVRHERREDIQVLGTLPCLCHLKFEVSWAREQQEVLERCAVGRHAFPCLVSCEFRILGRSVVPSMFPRGAMPRLHLTLCICMEDFFRSSGGAPFYSVDKDRALDHLLSLGSVTVDGLHGYDSDDNEEARNDMVRSVGEKFEHEAAAHPNNPRIHFKQS